MDDQVGQASGGQVSARACSGTTGESGGIDQVDACNRKRNGRDSTRAAGT